MSKTLAEFNTLVDAEQYFEFFELPYDPKTVNVNRLHILQKFSNTLKQSKSAITSLNEEETLAFYKNAFQEAYAVFLSSNSIEQKLFKVFSKKPQNVVLLNEIGVE